MSGNVSGGVSTLNSFVTAYRDPSYQCTATTPEAVQEAVWQQRRLNSGEKVWHILTLCV